MTVIIFSVDGGIPRKMDGTPHHIHRKIITVFPYHLNFNALKYFKVRLSLTLPTALLMKLLTTYFRFSGWRYSPSALTNQNHCYMQKLNDRRVTLRTDQISIKNSVHVFTITAIAKDIAS